MSLPASINNSIPLVTQMWLPLLNLFGNKEEVRIIITSPDYVSFRVLWGLISYERGEKYDFRIRGTDAYIAKLVSVLEKRGLSASAY